MRLLDVAKIGILLSAFGYVSQVHASGTTITTVVCNGSAGSSISIASPSSDSTVNQASFLVSGTVSGATQIEVRIDDAYNSTIPVAPAQSQYLFTATLTTGTHTIKIIANDVCAVKDDSASLVVTYQPSVIPVPGSEVPTDTGPALSSDGSAYMSTITSGIVEPAPTHKTSGVIVMPHSSSKTSTAASLPERVIDESKPETPSPIAPVVAAVPFVAGGGAAGFWWKWKLPKLK